MFGQNPIRGPEFGDGSLLYITEIFPTMQGEGPLAGAPAVFVRLGGCNLACKFCDTEFEIFEAMQLEVILEKIDDFARGKIKLVVITGGEPFRQEISLLCESLISKNYQVQIETNGTLYRKVPSEVMIVCSPKNAGIGYSKIRDDILNHAIAVKFLVSKTNKLYNFVPKLDLSVPIYIQPMDEYDPAKNEGNLKFAYELAMEYGYRISLQIHKILNIK